MTIQQKKKNKGIVSRCFVQISTHIQQAQASLSELIRTPFVTLMTVSVLAVSLSLPMLLQVIVHNTQQLSEQFDNSSDITLYIKKNTSKQALERVFNRIKIHPDLKGYQYIDAEQGLAEFVQRSELGNALNYLDVNPLPDVIVVSLKPEIEGADKISGLIRELEQIPQVEMVRLDTEWLEKVETVALVFKKIVFAVGVLLLLAVWLIIANTIRLSIINQKSQIEIMKLVGATDAFIRRPYLYMGMWFGIVAGVVASIIANMLILYLEFSIREIAELYVVEYQLESVGWQDMLNMMSLAAILGWGASYVSVKHHLKEIDPK